MWTAVPAPGASRSGVVGKTRLSICLNVPLASLAVRLMKNKNDRSIARLAELVIVVQEDSSLNRAFLGFSPGDCSEMNLRV
jgi:hypothetical protein